MHGVLIGDGEVVAVLVQVVAHRNLAAEGIAAAFDVELVKAVRVGLYEDRHIEARQLDRVRDTAFVTEVRQRDEDAVDAVGVLPEEFTALLGVIPRFDRAEFGRVFVENHRVNIEFCQHLKDIAPPLADQHIGEEVAVADDHA